MNCERCNEYSGGATLCANCERLALLENGKVDNGTPKTLAEAIERGVRADRINERVRDFLAQKFSTALIESDSNEIANAHIKALWTAIVGKKLK